MSTEEYIAVVFLVIGVGLGAALSFTGLMIYSLVTKPAHETHENFPHDYR